MSLLSGTAWPLYDELAVTAGAGISLWTSGRDSSQTSPLSALTLGPSSRNESARVQFTRTAFG